MSLRFGVHPHARIGDGQQDVIAGRHGRVPVGLFLLHPHIARFDHQLAAVGHGVACVDREIQDDLLDLSLIAPDSMQLRVQFGLQFNILADQAEEHLGHIGNDAINIERLGVEHLLPAKRQELAGEGAGPFACFADLLHLTAHGTPGLDLV